MESTEYWRKHEEIRQEYNKKTSDLSKEYADANNPYSVGDIFRDHMGVIRIEEIHYHLSYTGKTPSCKYWGLELKMNGEPKKKKIMREAYQVNEEHLNRRKNGMF